jgi:phenylalanyl-tRNA synthetase beta chain
VYGYNRLPVSHVQADLVIPAQPETRLSLRGVRRHLSARGYREAITYSFVDHKLQQLFDPDLTPIALENPISAEMGVMRSSLLPGLVSAVQRSVHRQQPRVRLFETGLRFIPGREGNGLQGLRQAPSLGMVISGRRFDESWSVASGAADFYDIKGDIESLLGLGRCAEQFTFAAATHPALHPGQTAALSRNGEQVGVVGALHPDVLSALDIPGPVFACELDLDALLAAQLPAFSELSRFPEVRRDIAIIVDKHVPAAELMQNVRVSAGVYLRQLRLFDVYEGKGIDPKRKSLAFGLTFRDQSRTLSDDVVNQSMKQVIDSLEKNYNAELRNQAL